MKIQSLMLLALLIFGCKEEVQKPTVTGMENKALLNFNILLPDSSTYFNTGNFTTGKRTILFYYSPTCQYSRAQMREMLNNIERYRDVQLCVFTNAGAGFKAMSDFNSYFKLGNVPNIITGIDTGQVFAKNYQVFAYPFTAIFDEQKRLKLAFGGRIKGKQLKEITDK